MLRTIDLDGIWQLRYDYQTPSAPKTPADLARSNWPTIKASVPGNVELDLISAGVLHDLSVGNRIYDLRKYETCDWWYSRTFPSPRFASGRRVELVFEGLDCLGTIWLNGNEIGSTANMLISHRFDVTDYLRDGNDNELVIRIASPVLEARRHEAEPIQCIAGIRGDGAPIRKAPHMYGWDIMPRIVSAGIWRDVFLEVIRPTRWRSVYWATLKTNPADGTATVLVDWDFTTERLDIDSLRVRIRLERNGRKVHCSEHPALTTHEHKVISLEDVELWWPRGYGQPALHDARIELID